MCTSRGHGSSAAVHTHLIGERVKDMEIGQPINSEECSETADGVARESKGVKSCPRAGCGKSACPVR